MQKRIDSLNEVNLEQITFEDIYWQFGTGISISTGNGRSKTYSYRNGVMTKLGDIEERVWYLLAEMLIERSGEQKILDSMLQWLREHNYTKDSPSELRKEALHLHTIRIFDSPRWVDFVRFNRKYRPEWLDKVHLATVTCECCGKPGETTPEQISLAYAGRIACPHCGRWSRFTTQEEAEK